MPLEAGTRVAERYRIVGPLGAGGMGVVYRAHDEKLGRQVALKTLPPSRVGDAKARARLLREARAVAALEHPGIAQVYDVGQTDDGGAFLVMELIRGHSLRDLIKTNAVERDEILDVVEQVAVALDFAHARGVIHRDIKPDNVMVRDDGRAVLLDFGLAKDVGLAMADTVDGDTPDVPDEPEHITKEGTLIGTLSYLAPEQARGRDVGPRSDQFALAATAYEALVGRLPWVGRDAAAVLAGILVDDAPPASSLESSLPMTVDRVLARALAKRAEDRFDDATAFARALRDAFERPDAAEAPARGEPAGGSGPSVPLLVTVGVVVAGALVASLLWRSDPDPTPPPAALPPDAVIGCPVMEAEGIEAPTGWLGAMGADLACRRLTFYLGGEPARAREPAELLDLPRLAVDGFPADPYAAEGARARSLAAARSLDGHLDGVVVRRESGAFTVRLSLFASRDEQPLATSEGEGDALYEAVGAAVRELAEDDALRVTTRIDDAIAPWLGTSDREIALAYEDLGESVLAGVGVSSICRSLIDREAELGPLRGEVGRVCARFRVEGAEALERPELDRSSMGALALTAAEHADSLEETVVRDLADQLAEARLNESQPFARATLARGEILLFEQLGEMDRARDLARTAAADHPEDWFLRVHLVRAVRRTPGIVAATRAAAAWHPGTPEAWRTLALPVRRTDDRAQIRAWLRRAYISGGAFPLTGIQLAGAILRDGGDRGEVRSIAARYATGDVSGRLAGEYVNARLEITEAQLGAALHRLQTAFLAHDLFGRLVDGDHDAMVWLIELAALLERGPEVADPLVAHFVLSDPARLDLGQPHYEVPMIRLCMIASDDVARRCLAALRAVREGRSARAGRVAGAEELLAGAIRHVERDPEGAVAAWRPLVRTRASWLPPKPFEEAGEGALLERILEARMRRDGFAGARAAHAIEATRAAAAGDSERARRLAQRVIDAWETADVSVPAVPRMRALMRELD